MFISTFKKYVRGCKRKMKISLKAKNPFGGDIELASWKTIAGLGLFAGMMGVIVVVASGVKKRAEKIGNPIDELWSTVKNVVR